MTDGDYTFVCPEGGCEHRKDPRTLLGGAIHVTVHYWFSHPVKCFEVGNPLSDTSAPSPEEFEAARAEVADD